MKALILKIKCVSLIQKLTEQDTLQLLGVVCMIGAISCTVYFALMQFVSFP